MAEDAADKPTSGVVLLVCEEDEFISLPETTSSVRLEYRFTDHYPQDGFAGWESTASDSCALIEVASYCRSLEGGFRHQALNRYLAHAVIQEKPSAIVICGVWGCTVDLPRIAHMMGVPCILVLAGWERQADAYDVEVRSWLIDAMRRCRYLVGDLTGFMGGQDIQGSLQQALVGESELPARLLEIASDPVPQYAFDYSTYEFVQRDHPLLAAMQQSDARHFADCDHVLDIGCGAGIFLDCLRRQGIDAIGVERDPIVAEYGRGMGLQILTHDAIDFLETTEQRFDGVYCAHFVEHLPIEAVEKLLRLMFRVLKPGGLLVLIFPDPESIRSQLLGFWRDPEHVRFYHPELVLSMAMAVGFRQQWSSYQEQPHEVGPFPLQPAPLTPLAGLEMPPPPPEPGNWVARTAARLGWHSPGMVAAKEEGWSSWARSVCDAVQTQQANLQQLESRTEDLWSVNKTWAWNDNATLTLRRND